MDRYRGRSPDRRHQAPPSDTYVPSGRPSRPRSRSPGPYRGRSRTPPRAAHDGYRGQRRFEEPYPPRDSRPRSPRRDYPPDSRYDESRNPRERSPALKRGRDASPGRMRSPPPAKREKMASPGRDYARRSPPRPGYRPRSRSPRRDDREDQYASSASWRRRSPSPRARPEGRSGAADDYRNAPAYRSPRPRSPRRDAHESAYGEESYNSRPRYQEEHATNGSGYQASSTDPRDRPPPTGPANSMRDPAADPPSGPMSMSAHSRHGGAYPSSGPGYSRGGYRGRGGPPSRDYPPRDYNSGPRRGSSSWGGPPGYSRGGGYGSREGYPPRESFGYAPRGGGGGSSTSLTTPRTQRFNTALQDVAKPKEGGEKLPPLHDMSRADKLEEEAARLRKKIDEKEMMKRQGMREWERLERESSNSALRTELAEEHLKNLNGEEALSTAAF